MGFETKIAWTDATWNPWHGCTRVSAGCDHCYMYRDKKRFGLDPATVIRSTADTFTLPNRIPEGSRIFTCSWSDFFHPDADPWRQEAYDIIANNPDKTFQVLTKRPERIATYDRAVLRDRRNIWLGVTVENNAAAGRLDILRTIDSEVRFVSFEPLLELIAPLNLQGIHWAICGGESGPGFRPMDPHWAQTIRSACIYERIPFFMKQMAGVRPAQVPIPEYLRSQEFP